jgi:hypothetical protein
MRELEQSLGLNPDTEPVWGYEEPDKQLFPEEAPTSEQRKLAADCLGQLFYLVEENKAPGLRRPALQPGELVAATEQYRTEAQEQWASSVPFPNFNIEHLLGAIKRQMAWVKEVREFEETQAYDGALQI